MKECLKEQINLGLPWLTEINKIACKLQVDLDSAKVLSKVQWKTLVKEKVLAVAKEYMEKQIATLKGYKTYVEDNIVVGKKKRYIFQSLKPEIRGVASRISGTFRIHCRNTWLNLKPR